MIIKWKNGKEVITAENINKGSNKRPISIISACFTSSFGVE